MLIVLSHRRRPALMVGGLALALLLLACLAPGRAGSPVRYRAAAATAPEAPSYISLGDSLAAGSQPDPDGNDGPTNQGYADVLGRRLQKTYPGMKTIKLSCGGVTTRTIIAGGSCDGAPPQLVGAERYLKAHSNVRLVTVDVGDNDVEGCIRVNPPNVDPVCVANGRTQIARNLPIVLKRLRAVAGPHTAIVGITDYNQFLALWNDGPAGQGVARRSMHIIRSLNNLMGTIYKANGIPVAAAGDRFRSDDLTTMRTIPRFGRVPLAVARICQWTWACSDPPIGHDDHAKPHGYQVIAETVLDRLAQPSGGS